MSGRGTMTSWTVAVAQLQDVGEQAPLVRVDGDFLFLASPR
jgi:hypothetical protein